MARFWLDFYFDNMFGYSVMLERISLEILLHLGNFSLIIYIAIFIFQVLHSLQA